jgi:uncharacterized protein with HEPN domain
MERTHVDFLNDIVAAAEKAMGFIQGLDYETFLRDERTQFAVVRALEIVGEATKQVPQSIRDAHANVPWRSMAGMRDKLIHNYVSVNPEIVWRSVTEDLPPLVPILRQLLLS